MNIERSSKAEFKAGTGSVGTSAQKLAEGFPAAKSVTVKASAANTGNLYVGDAGSVSASNGFLLAKGESVEIAIDAADKIWIVADAAAQGYSWVAV